MLHIWPTDINMRFIHMRGVSAKVNTRKVKQAKYFN